MQHCPVCLGRVSSELFNAHMSSHSKDEVVSALLRQPLAGNVNFATSSLLQASVPGSNPTVLPSSQIPTTVTASRTNVASSSSAQPDVTNQGTIGLFNQPGFYRVKRGHQFEFED